MEVISFYQLNESEVEESKAKAKVNSKLPQKVEETCEVKRKEQEQDVQTIKAIRGVVSNKYIAIGDHGKLETTVSICVPQHFCCLSLLASRCFKV